MNLLELPLLFYNVIHRLAFFAASYVVLAILWIRIVLRLGTLPPN
jgi:hypothetical protein